MAKRFNPFVLVYHNSVDPIAAFRSQAQADKFIERMGRNGFGGMTTEYVEYTAYRNEWVSTGYSNLKFA